MTTLPRPADAGLEAIERQLLELVDEELAIAASLDRIAVFGIVRAWLDSELADGHVLHPALLLVAGWLLAHTARIDRFATADASSWTRDEACDARDSARRVLAAFGWRARRGVAVLNAIARDLERKGRP